MYLLSLSGLLLSYLLSYKYVALFTFIFLAGVGFPIPLNTLIIAVGAFAGRSYFNLHVSLAVALFANILGDLLGYFLVRRYGNIIAGNNYLKKFPLIVALERDVEFLEKYIKSHQKITIFLTRFWGTAAVIVNFLSGAIPVKLKTFIIYDALGNFFDISFMILLGFFVGESWQNIIRIGGIMGALTSLLVISISATLIIKQLTKARRRK
jgi:membrane protein DedA with SNARE-associated domain